ncbi:cytochrome P450 [Sphingoaurantiacus capsulatus]|uniref:Cytochrome P450 n=1 Tax=Sphingoaurantiacus capsulatus TaxID=1771310 RepID=A0ABV7XB96_9SPHN
MNAPVPPQSFETPADRFNRLPVPRFEDLTHIPGQQKPPYPFAHTIKFLKDPLAHTRHHYETYGSVFRRGDFGGWGVTLIGPEANELVLFNKERIFSSEQGWNPVLDRLFPRGLMLMDDPEHRSHRKTLGVAFKPEPMRHYLGALNEGIARGIAAWPGEFKFYPAIKALTLDLAATSFLGIEWGPEADKINQSFVDMVQASVGIIRRPIPGTAMWRGVKGRKFMCEFFAREIPNRRGREGDDFFTQFCNARDENGELLSDQEVIDHMNFLMMAAHDTLTSSLTSTVYYLAANPEWQDWVREEITAYGPGPIAHERLGELERTEMAFKEAMRLLAPVPGIPRRAVKDFVFRNHHIPAGTPVGVNPMLTHRLPDVWPDPDRFDPMRFTAEASKGRHKYAWVPFGGGAHMCLGLHFAYMQAKAFFFELLKGHRVTLAPGYQGDFQMFPMPKPKDGLPVRLERL